MYILINSVNLSFPKILNNKSINKDSNKIISNLTLTENATVFQGVLEFLHQEDPDLICVIQRKRGFFKNPLAYMLYCAVILFKHYGSS